MFYSSNTLGYVIRQLLDEKTTYNLYANVYHYL